MKIKTKQAISIILSIAGSIGTVATALLAIKATPKAQKKYEEVKDGTFLDKTKAVLPVYLPTIAVGAATIASNTCSIIISRKTEASLIAVATMAEQCYGKYKSKVKELLGIDKHKEVMDAIAEDEKKTIDISDEDDDRFLYYEEHIGYFRTTPDNFAIALKNLDDYIEERGFVTLGDFLSFCDGELCEYDPKKVDALNNIGWDSEYLFETQEVYTIKVTLGVSGDDPKTHTLEFHCEPVIDPEGWYDRYMDEFHEQYQYAVNKEEKRPEQEKLCNDEERLLNESV